MIYVTLFLVFTVKLANSKIAATYKQANNGNMFDKEKERQPNQRFSNRSGIMEGKDKAAIKTRGGLLNMDLGMIQGATRMTRTDLEEEVTQGEARQGLALEVEVH